MTTRFRHFTFGLLALVCAAVISSCTTEETGQTLTVEFTTESGLLIQKTASGTPFQPAQPPVPASGITPGTPGVPAVAATPNVFSGSAVIVAKVTYKGKETLSYNWTYSLPAPMGGTATSSTNTLTIKATANTEYTGGSDTLTIPAGAVGTATLEVYTKDGRISEKATTTIQIIRGFGA